MQEQEGSYESDLVLGLKLSGEDRKYFSNERIRWLSEAFTRRQLVRPRSAMDFGCGDGASIAGLMDVFTLERVVGVDVSIAAVSAARRRYPGNAVEFRVYGRREVPETVDLVYTNGVFHHIRSDRRSEAMEFIAGSLRTGGVLSLWENNPWNPAAMAVMRRIPFDHDAEPLSSLSARRLVEGAGLDVLQVDFRFIFPRWLSWFRPMEVLLARLPMGAQYQVLAVRK